MVADSVVECQSVTVEQDLDTEAVWELCFSAGPETLVLYRRRPARLPNLPASHYGAHPIQLFEGSRGSEAFMQIQWCGGYEKGFGNRWRS